MPLCGRSRVKIKYWIGNIKAIDFVDTDFTNCGFFNSTSTGNGKKLGTKADGEDRNIAIDRIL